MYHQNHRFNSRGKRGNFGGKQGGFRHKSFDPTFIIQNSQTGTSLPQEEYVAKNTFNNFAISEKLKANITYCGYKTPTPIQDQAIPQLLDGRDLVGIAKTGTGKTAAFLIPLVNKIVKNPQEKVLILAPTRELAVQIREELEKLIWGLNVRSVLCIGGVSMHGQIKILYKNPQFVVGTPGRLKDLEKQRKLNLAGFKNVVLDEIDRMLDMGFIKDVNYIISKLPISRQSLFFSATLSPQIQAVMSRFLHSPVTIRIASNLPTTNVEQDVIRINGKPKIEVLHEMLIKKDFEKVLIFGRTKFGIEKLSRELIHRGFRAASIHGNKSQSQRQRAITDFKNDYIKILLATDIASRGLDINNVTHVINYDLPESYEDYIHRIGRTGRAGKRGMAFTFVG